MCWTFRSAGPQAHWALFNFRSITCSMPYTQDLNQPGLIFKAIYDPIWGYNQLAQILLIELGHNPSHVWMLLEHLDAGHNPVAETLSPARAVF
jgi:hypothetical protein